MSASNRDRAITKTLGYEGGYGNNPADPGGPTNYGITIADVRLYVKPNATAEDVKALTKAQAIDIYRSKYWAKVNADSLPAGVDLAVFDYGVNSGVARANKVYPQVKKSTPAATVQAICAQRLGFLKALRTWGTFGKGWGRRVADVEATGVKWALEAEGHAPEVVQKKLKTEAKKATTTATTHGAGGVAGAGAGGATAPDLSSWDLSTKLGIAAAVVAVVAFVGWRVYVHYQRSRAYTEAAGDSALPQAPLVPPVPTDSPAPPQAA